MSFKSRIVSTIFTAVPGFVLFAWHFASGMIYKDYYWGTYSSVFVVLVVGSVLFGFTLPTLFQGFGLRQPWMWIMASGILAGILALLILALLNATPLCVGQDNGDGNNDFGMCMAYTVLTSIVFTPIFLFMQTISALIGHWVLKWRHKGSLENNLNS